MKMKDMTVTKPALKLKERNSKKPVHVNIYTCVLSERNYIATIHVTQEITSNAIFGSSYGTLDSLKVDTEFLADLEKAIYDFMLKTYEKYPDLKLEIFGL